MSDGYSNFMAQYECMRCKEAGFPEMWRETGDGHVCKSATVKTVVAQNSTTISSNSIANVKGDGSVTYSEPKIDKKKPKPKVKYVKLVPKMVVIECRCGGNLESFGGITKGMGPTMWKHKCPNCSTWYELKEQAGSIIYE